MSPAGSASWRGDVVTVARAVVPRPSLWWVSLATLGRLARRGWWHRAPFLPVPGAAYWRFRLITAFGGTGEDAAPTTADVVAYLRWCRRTHPRRG